MKKAILTGIVSIVVLTVAFLNLNYAIREKESPNVIFNNLEALAHGEIIVGPFCAHIDDRICWVDSDGYFLRGVRVY